MKQVNKTMGNHFEEELCELLAGQGFWAHNLAQNQVGQPADVLAVRDNIAVLVDCKVCSNNRFPLSRIEPNQEAAMTMWEAQGNEHCYFAMKLNDGQIYMIHFDELCLRQLYGQGSITESEFPEYPRSIEMLEKMADIFHVPLTYLQPDQSLFIERAAEAYGKKGKIEAQHLAFELTELFASGELTPQDMDGIMYEMHKAYFKYREQKREKERIMNL